jgi:hypothetical protein
MALRTSTIGTGARGIEVRFQRPFMASPRQAESLFRSETVRLTVINTPTGCHKEG